MRSGVFEHLCSSLNLSNKSVIVMLEAYFDESGTQGEKSSAVTVAGFVAEREQWSAFGVEWAEFLRRERIKVFHRTELESFWGEFKRENGWDEDRRDKVVRESQVILGKYIKLGFAHSVIKADYDEIVVGKVRQKLGAQYYTFCAQSCMRKIAAWAAHAGHNEAINYFFETGAKGIGELGFMMDKTRKRREAKAAFRLGSLIFANKYDEIIDGVLFPGILQLQAADILAYEVFKLMDNQYANNSKRPMRESMIQILGLPFSLYMTYHEKRELRELVQRVESGDLLYA